MKLTDVQKRELDIIYTLSLELSRLLAALIDVAADDLDFDYEDYVTKWHEYQTKSLDLGLHNRYFSYEISKSHFQTKPQQPE
ncbi:MAG: hypothetical protein SAJ12_07310 [Jaaginema sp. PMC 1079.18]|nr:hypothetical protein [Jaaginema sp. PMC 1080.18]MEC4850805.1 hypothetical protein [Jaaginema sp. PMC 1079.18]MEC4868176.1 hypothetical protein [Jaaginema sp. PMC 1078.18]